jgi:arylsulfatase A-like enzyme
VTPVQLPKATDPFVGTIGRLVAQSEPRPLTRRAAPQAAPNVLVILLDDVGFASGDVFGGPVPMPTVAKLAAEGLRFNQFHTTALCSPTRAAMLTGRNHHSVHMGGIPEGANSFPGYDSVIPPESATFAQILRHHGYATGCFGKWHLTPTWEQGPAGPYDRWPMGLGFDRFYGIIGAESSQYEPPIYDQTTPVEPYVDKPNYHLTEDLADKAIEWIERCQATSPDSPFLCYFSTAAVHTPHHVPSEWSDRFRGQFDDGWDALRERAYERQLELGVIPPGTVLTPRPEQIPAWEDYPERYRPVASRLMEVFAGFLAHTDAQIGRVIDAIDRLGLTDNTIVLYLVGDNGASAEGTIHGAWSAPSFQNGVPEDPEWLLDHIDDFGTERCENHFNVGWAWALDSPFQWMKQVASHFGGTRNGMVLRWPDGMSPESYGGLRSQFHHVVDIFPTILDAIGIPMPTHVAGIEQSPVDGASMRYCFDDPNAPTSHPTQYFEILGNRGMYHDGWMASCFHGRVPWIRFAGFEFDGDQERWELYDITNDFSQSRDLASEHPERLAALVERFESEASRSGAYPFRDPSTPRTAALAVPQMLGGRTTMTYTTAHVRIPESAVVNLKNTSFRITAHVRVPDGGASGVIACQGGNMSGWSLYLDDDGVPVFLYNCFGHDLTFARAPHALSVGSHTVVVEFAYDGGFGAGGQLNLIVDGVDSASSRIDRTVPIVFSMSGETFDVGVDTGAPVGPYPHRYPCTASIETVTLERLTELDPETSRLVRQGTFRASLASQ